MENTVIIKINIPELTGKQKSSDNWSHRYKILSKDIEVQRLSLLRTLIHSIPVHFFNPIYIILKGNLKTMKIKIDYYEVMDKSDARLIKIYFSDSERFAKEWSKL